MRFIVAGNKWVVRRHATLLCNFIHFTTKTKFHRVHQPWRIFSARLTGDMKRERTDTGAESKAKRQRVPEADYCDVMPRKDGHGNAIWPASMQSIERARDFLKEW